MISRDDLSRRDREILVLIGRKKKIFELMIDQVP
jgi:hypothetical protein